MISHVIYSQLSINGHYGFRTAATHFIEIQQLRLLHHKVAYTKQQLSFNNQACKINSMQGPQIPGSNKTIRLRTLRFTEKTMPIFFSNLCIIYLCSLATNDQKMISIPVAPSLAWPDRFFPCIGWGKKGLVQLQ